MTVLETKRLRLRPLELGDLNELHRVIFSDPGVTRYLPMREPISIEQVAERLGRRVSEWREWNRGVWAVTEMATGELVGQCGFILREDGSPSEVIYALGRRFWRRGLAREAVAAVLAYAFSQLALAEVAALILPDNKRSIGVVQSFGFRYAGMTSRFGVDLLRFSLTAEDFGRSQENERGSRSD